MNMSSESVRPIEELLAIYEESAAGILIAEIGTRRLLSANRAICEMLGYSEKELLSLSIDDIHPPESLPHALDLFDAMGHRRLKCARGVLCRRKNGDMIYADIAAHHIASPNRPCMVGFFHDVTEQKRTMESLCACEERHRLIADNVADVIWTVDFSVSDVQRAMAGADVAAAVDAIADHWRFSYVSQAVKRVFDYSPEEAATLSLRDITTPDSFARGRDAMIEEFCHAGARSDSAKQRVIELEFLAKDGCSRWCEVVSTYMRDDRGVPTGMLGITRDVTERREAEKALRESEGTLRSLFENLPDILVMADQDGNVLFINRDQPQYIGKSLVGECGISVVAPEFRDRFRHTLSQVISTGRPQSLESQDILGLWWSFRFAPLVRDGSENGDGRAMIICTNITQERRASEAIEKERQLLRRMLDLHERERQLIAYEIHDGFAQQLTGALFRLQGFRETLANNAAEAWKGFDSATQLLCRAIDETRRLISGLRPPILDEMGVIEAVQYLVYEQRKDGGPEIEFEHDMDGERFPPPLENAIFRIVQESLGNACRHSRSPKVHVAIGRRNGRLCIGIRDWGIGFDPRVVAEQRFGLQGIRERVRLLEGRVAIESAPGKGTHIAVELPLSDVERIDAVIFDMDGVLVDTYQAHYQSWRELAEAEGLHVTEADFARLFGRTSREIIACLWGKDRYDDAQIAEFDRRKEASFRRAIEANFPAMPGASELLRALHEAGFRLAVGSSGPPENVALVVDRLGARDLFDAIVTGDDVTRGKPDPEVFLIAAKRLGVAPANCAVIEDAPAGIAAANAAGMASVGLLSTGRKPDDLTAAHAVVRSLAELSPQVLRDLIAERPLSASHSERETVS
jgi:beta-phosphoglucomutase